MASSSSTSSSEAPPPIALVTAGSAGLGAAVAELFARSGMRVVINYHGNAERAAALVARLKEITTLAPQPDRVDYHAVRADLSQRADVARLVADAVAVMCPPSSSSSSTTATTTTQRLDVVFSNGGWTHMRTLLDLDDNMVDDDWDRCFTMNVKSHLWLMHAARPYLEAAYSDERGAASFITTASLAGVKVSGSSLAYAVTKAAQLHLAKGLALIAAPKIRVNSVSPGLLLTVSCVLSSGVGGEEEGEVVMAAESPLTPGSPMMHVILLLNGEANWYVMWLGMGTEIPAREDKDDAGDIEAKEARDCRGE